MKRPRTAWAAFLGERTKSSDFNGIAVTERIKLVAAEWKALNADEKKVRFLCVHTCGGQELMYFTEIRR